MCDNVKEEKLSYFTVSMLKETCTSFELPFKTRDSKRNDPWLPVLSGRIITPSSSDAMALVAVYNGEIASWLWKLHFFLFCFDFVTWFCHNLNRHASLLRNILTGNQTASFHFQVGISSSAVLSHHFARNMYIFRVVHKKKFTCKNIISLHTYKKL